jgi:NarL family two-component system response regulator LiaR
MEISALIIDQERAFTDAMASCLEAEDDITVVAAAQAAEPGSSLAAGGHANIVLLDADLADGAAIRLCRKLSARGGASRAIMLSSSAEPERIVAAIRAGAAAWVRKDESLGHLLRVIRGVARGETWLPPAEAGNVLWLLIQQQDRQRESDRALAALTAREREVLACLAHGASQHDVAGRLHLSVNTVRTHLRNLTIKLGARSPLEAVALTGGWAGQSAADGGPRP